MAQDRLFRLASRLQPALRMLPPAQRINAYGELVPLLFTAPLAILAVVWLVWTTDLAALVVGAPALPLLLASGYAFRRYVSYVSWEPLAMAGEPYGGESRLRFAVSSWPLLVWAAALIWGSGMLWLLVVWPLQHLRLTYRYSLWRSEGRHWWRLSLVSQALALGVLPGLLALRLIDAMGGVVTAAPLPLTLGPLFLAGAVMGMAPVLAAWPMVDYLLAFVNAAEARSSLWRRLLSIAGLLLLAYLFASLGAGFMLGGGLLSVVLFAAGMWLATYLVYRLNAAAEESRQEIAMLAQLERLAQAMLSAPVEQTNLPAILGSVLPAVLGPAWLEITLFPDETLYHQGLDWPPVEAAVWERLQATRAPFLLLPMAARSPDGRAALNAIVVPIDDPRQATEPDGDAPAGGGRIGGIYLVLHRHLGEASRWLPPLRSIAGQIAAARQREGDHRRVIDYQARLYQQEVYAQSFKAEALAERLAHQQVRGELRLAGEIQASLLPKYAPEVPGWDIAVSLEPARDASGDFYDFIPLPDGRMGLLMADVAGKGIGAALYMAVSKTLIRTYALEYAAEPARAFAAANDRMLADTQGDWFVTAFYGVLDPAEGTLTYVNAGHNPPLLYAGPNVAEPLALWRTGIPLGLFGQQTWEQKVAHLSAAAVLVLYTDGVTEAQDAQEDLFGLSRLRAVVGSCLTRPAEVIEFSVFSAIEAFVGDAPQFDDIALMIVARDGEA